ncbi:response regulator transcription factor [Nostocoides sp. Soil756]|jgi:DNA-binding NarL/FixJ family response regulator|uniref:response regulator n=1 Tax=Nostocoides sp. Soil756 TaxID=1736399 RepID=UPI0006FF4ED6|nr:response regulator transcription factor [Tetrasphaera sp. Soil756]KRE60842.1 LuxR family transcriptional regulator [Tetrasphaera sp. Soil756]
MIRVLLADDQVLVRDGFRALIDRETDLSVVAEAADGIEAVQLVRAHRPDVVLMDIRMPNIDGLTATRHVLALPEPPKVLVLTTFDRNEWVYEALRAGASGFLLKDVRGSQLTDAIRTVAAGEALLSPTITRRLIADLVARRPAPGPRPAPVELTAREAEVLRLVAAGHSNAEIAEQLFISHSTVKTHVTRLLTKLDLRDRVQAVVYAYETGFVRPPA